MYAHCYRSGEIELSRRSNLAGLICIGQGTKDILQQKLACRARLAYDNKTWLVPGIPEADSDDAAELALENFVARFSAPVANPMTL